MMKVFVVKVGDRVRLVKAQTLKAAWKWVAEQEVTASVATPEDAWRLAGEGIKLEEAA
jgi:hypothetical protein